WARGYELEKFLATYEPGWLPLTNADKSLSVGPFKSARAAERDLDKFQRAFFRQLPRHGNQEGTRSAHAELTEELTTERGGHRAQQEEAPPWASTCKRFERPTRTTAKP